jgi:hypothetical protein
MWLVLANHGEGEKPSREWGEGEGEYEDIDRDNSQDTN